MSGNPSILSRMCLAFWDAYERMCCCGFTMVELNVCQYVFEMTSGSSQFDKMLFPFVYIFFLSILFLHVSGIQKAHFSFKTTPRNKTIGLGSVIHVCNSL